MRFLIKLIMKLHIKIWTWFKPWGERPVVGKATHFANAFCNAMDQPSTFLPFVFGSLVGREMEKPAGGSWVPLLWRVMFFVFFVFAVLDLVISVFAFVYILIITIPVTFIILIPMKSVGAWTGGSTEDYGHISNEYLYGIWQEVDVEHDLYLAQNLLQSRMLFHC